MRNAFIKTLEGLAEKDPRILLLTGDLGYMVLDTFADKFPGRFYNVGVAEQNMVGLATGLAEAGFIPFVYSIATFASLRPYEFIRNGPIMHQFPVRIVGIGGGFEYGHNGPTHYGLEDLNIMRVQPGITVIAPADFQQARSALLATWDLPGPIYYRFGKGDKTPVPGLEGRFELERAQVIREGRDLLLVTLGSITGEAVAAAEALAAEGISCKIMVVSCLNPAPVEHLAQELARFSAVMTVEAHYLAGGLGSLVSEIIAERGLRCRVWRSGVKTPMKGIYGSQSYMHRQYGLSREASARSSSAGRRTSW